ncbi:rubrerythrin [Clostridium algidicarnis]|uniref:Rubrerythrin n=2 Tax=Clostridium algidicarnis TaxID=37659 RepID=A0A2S6FUA8_9CLOT|nr:rubrerythrin family protein [Clostridium algidicarnis]MBB6632464.1 rubrerythrin family protein [Clostridium algidicarnis]MBU3194949.1 rubrerythrin family protein [Clostridium algidicarnis]MBU3197637.1 rubrerythrin family protein [Clostridium algidicarnis]MBU3205355.1 rubrerythrin family protein [Clostridium algidicarnis]MBU3207942.1 rubrerythrin family protein [Clostridium algidicarnis]
MNSLKGTKTAENLLKAFAGECQARTRYDYYSSTAKKEGYVQISEIFAETARNEKEHAKRFFKFLNETLKGDQVVINGAGYPVMLGNTKENLLSAAEGENEEWSDLYPSFANVADEEGFKEIARVFRNIAKVEAEHEKRYRKLLENIETNKVFKREEKTFWKCINCGFIIESQEAPKVCPSCDHPQEYFELYCQNY